MLDAFGKPVATVLGFYDEPGIGHEIVVAPGFDIAESHKLVALHCNHGLAFHHFLRDILRLALCDAGTAHLRCGFNLRKNLIHILQMLL